ncbi:VanZ family protein [Cupriavidus basilensis]
MLVVYASLYPFAGWTDTGVSPFAFLSAPLPRYDTGFDLLTNVWGYMPLGMLTVLALHPRITGWRAVLVSLLAGLLLSGAMEAIQTYLPTRVSSNVDLATNSAGRLAGRHRDAAACARLSIGVAAPAAPPLVRGRMRPLRSC